MCIRDRSKAVNKLLYTNKIKSNPIISQICAISCGVWNGFSVLDLDYSEDSSAEIDTNFVLTSDQKLVEVQISSESDPFTKSTMDGLLNLAFEGSEKIFKQQLRAVNDL